jgi:hypothetical protein
MFFLAPNPLILAHQFHLLSIPGEQLQKLKRYLNKMNSRIDKIKM